MSSKTFPFLQGATNATERAHKTHKLIYGSKRMAKLTQHQSLASSSSPREKPAVETLLLNSPTNKIPELIRSAHLAGELENYTTLNNVLEQFKKFRRYDKGLAVCRSFEKETGKSLLPRHFVTLMSMALNSSNHMEQAGSSGTSGWTESLRLFTAGFVARKERNPLSSPAVGAAMVALNAGGKWQDSIGMFTQAIADKIPLDSKAVHGLVFHLRNNNRWDLALQAFDFAAKNGTSPEYHLYRELFYAIRDSALKNKTNAVTAWEFALSVATAIEPVCPMNAGIYNVLISTCAIPAPKEEREASQSVVDASRQKVKFPKRLFPHWEAGLRVLQHLQDRVILSAVKDNSSRTIINANTIAALSALRPGVAEHQIKCLDLARQHGLPTPDTVYFNLLRALDKTQRSDEALAFVQKISDQAINDPSNLGLSLTPLFTGLLDSLASHPVPEAALVTAKYFHSALLPLVASTTAGCAIWGDETQAWIVESKTKVAVLGSGVLELLHHGPVVDVLLSKFDAIMIPYTAVRVLIKKLEKEANHTQNATKMVKAIHMLRRLQIMENPNKEGTGFVQVLPFIHHLKALNYLKTCSPYYHEPISKKENDEKVLLEGANEKGLLETSAQDKKQKLKSTKFLSAATTTTTSGSAKNNFNNAMLEKITISTTRDDENGTVQVSSSWNQPKNNNNSQMANVLPPWFVGNPKYFDPAKWMTPSSYEWSHSIATSLMLSRLNPDANIVVVTREKDITSNACKFYGVKRVEYETLVNESPFRFEYQRSKNHGQNDEREREEKKVAGVKKQKDVIVEQEGKSTEKKRSDNYVRAATSPNM